MPGQLVRDTRISRGGGTRGRRIASGRVLGLVLRHEARRELLVHLGENALWRSTLTALWRLWYPGPSRHRHSALESEL